MKINWKKIKLTKEEKAIERAIERGEYVSVSPEQFRETQRAIEHKRKEILRDLVRRKKDAVLNLRINSQDLESLKQKAKQHGVPYQTFISEILHRHAA
jgi:predicted DNA binding CopG/RHH family protein